jgi:molybdopterin converting factor small subunit
MAIQNLDENIDGVEDLKKQIQAIKDNLEISTVSESSTLMHEVSQFNVELESFLSEADQVRLLLISNDSTVYACSLTRTHSSSMTSKPN